MHFYSFTVTCGSELIFIVKIRITFFLGAAAAFFEAILVIIYSGSFVLSVLLETSLGTCFTLMPGLAASP